MLPFVIFEGFKLLLFIRPLKILISFEQEVLHMKSVQLKY